jgi:hypothetical protein
MKPDYFAFCAFPALEFDPLLFTAFNPIFAFCIKERMEANAQSKKPNAKIIKNGQPYQ